MTRDYQQFPDDENGDVLWQMYEDGNDLSDLHEVEFSIVLKLRNWQKSARYIYCSRNKKFPCFRKTSRLTGQTYG